MASGPLPLSERLAHAIVLSPDPLGSDKVTLDVKLAEEAVGAIELAGAAYRACMSAWACGEPPHRVEAMIASVEQLGTALGEPGAPRKPMRPAEESSGPTGGCG